MQSSILEHTVAPEDAGDRLDRILKSSFPELSRARFQVLIADGRVTVNGATIVEAKYRVKPAEFLRVEIPPAQPATPEAEDIALDIAFEDEHLIVVNKPAGMVVHPSQGHAGGTLVNALLGHCGDSLSGIGGVKRPGIVHRLDQDTSGLLVVAKSDRVHRGLAAQFASHGRDGRLKRLYHAIAWGEPQPVIGTIDAALARHRHDRLKMAVTKTGGREAVTHYRVLARYPAVPAKARTSLLACELETGRTHQIRVHLAHKGHPILGDETYASGFKASAGTLGSRAQAALKALGRQALHAALLGFEHPVTRREIVLEADAPPDFADLLEALKTEN